MSEQTLLNVLLVDDEAPARDELAFLLGQHDAIGRIEQAADATHCLELLAHRAVDAIFLDVRMPNLDGLALARVIARMANPPLVVFVTAFADSAVEAFGLDAVDYLLKPVRPERLGVTIRRLAQARTRVPAGRVAEIAEPALDRLAVSSGTGQILVIPVDEIRAVVVEDERTTVLTPDGRYSVRYSLGELEQRLRRHSFLRVHRAYLVNLKHVASIESFFNGSYLLKLSGLSGVTVPVSRRHAALLRTSVGL